MWRFWIREKKTDVQKPGGDNVGVRQATAGDRDGLRSKLGRNEGRKEGRKKETLPVA